MSVSALVRNVGTQCCRLGARNMSRSAPVLRRRENVDVIDAMSRWMEDSVSRLERDFHRTLSPFYARPFTNLFEPFGFTPSKERRFLSDNSFVSEADLRFRVSEDRKNISCEVILGEDLKPEDVEVNVRGRNVEFKAKKEVKSEDGKMYSYREFKRQFTLPEQVDAEKIQASWCEGGKLVLEAPLTSPLPDKDKRIPIDVKRDTDTSP